MEVQEWAGQKPHTENGRGKGKEAGSSGGSGDQKVSANRFHPVSAEVKAMPGHKAEPLDFLMQADDKPWGTEGRLLRPADSLPHTSCVRLLCASLSLQRVLGAGQPGPERFQEKDSEVSLPAIVPLGDYDHQEGESMEARMGIIFQSDD